MLHHYESLQYISYTFLNIRYPVFHYKADVFIMSYFTEVYLLIKKQAHNLDLYKGKCVQASGIICVKISTPHFILMLHAISIKKKKNNMQQSNADPFRNVPADVSYRPVREV